MYPSLLQKHPAACSVPVGRQRVHLELRIAQSNYDGVADVHVVDASKFVEHNHLEVRRVVDFEDEAFEFVILGLVFDSIFLARNPPPAMSICVHLDNLIVLQTGEVIRSAHLEVERRIVVSGDGKVATQRM